MRIIAFFVCVIACVIFMLIVSPEAITFTPAFTVGLLGAVLTALLFISLRLGEIEKLIKKINSDKEENKQHKDEE